MHPEADKDANPSIREGHIDEELEGTLPYASAEEYERHETFCLAVSEGNFQVVAEGLEQGIDPCASDFLGSFAAFRTAASHGQIEMLEYLFAESNASIEDSAGAIAKSAVIFDQLEVLHWLKQNDQAIADIDSPLLESSIHYGCDRITNFLIKEGVDLLRPDIEGNPAGPIHMAIMMSDIHTVRELTEIAMPAILENAEAIESLRETAISRNNHLAVNYFSLLQEALLTPDSTRGSADVSLFRTVNRLLELPSNGQLDAYKLVSATALFVSSLQLGESPEIERSLFQSILDANVTRIEESEKVTLSKFVKNLRANPASLQEPRDLLDDFIESVVLPAYATDESIHKKLKRVSNNGVVRLVELVRPIIAADLFSNGRDLSAIGRQVRFWGRNDISPSSEARPLRALGSWSALIKDRQVGDCTITARTSAKELREEGKHLRHCLGKASYTTRCRSGRTHILSILDNSHSLGTVELEPHEQGEIRDRQTGNGFRVIQKRGELNGPLPEAAKKAWDEFVSKVEDGEISFSREFGETKESKQMRKRLNISPYEVTTGVALGRYPTQMIDFYNSIILRSSGSSMSKLVDLALVPSTLSAKLQPEMAQDLRDVLDKALAAVWRKGMRRRE